MTRAAGFTTADIMRALKPALTLGLTVTRYEIGKDGQIVVYTTADDKNHGLSVLDTWKSRREAR